MPGLDVYQAWRQVGLPKSPRQVVSFDNTRWQESLDANSDR
jgi:hypothetical protein